MNTNNPLLTPSKTFLPDGIPDELKQHDQWVVWKHEQRQGRLTKIPYDSKSGKPAATNNPETWSTIQQACDKLKQGFAGVGFVFTAEDPYVGVDLDHCRNAVSGELAPWAQEIVNGLASYTEISQSGTGVHIFVKGALPGTKRKKPVDGGGAIEMYDQGRYFIMTGNRLHGTPDTIKPRQKELESLHSRTFGETESIIEAPCAVTAVTDALDEKLSTELLQFEVAKSPPPGTDNDDELLRRARSAQGTGPKFVALYDKGDLTEYNGDESSADLALCSKLAYWTRKDRNRIDRLFRKSALMRAKWDEPRSGRTYGSLTIEKSLRDIDDINEPLKNTPTNKGPVIRSWNEITQSTTADLRYVVDKLIPEGGVTLMIARQKAGKSMLASQMSIDVAEGKPFLGALPTASGPVLYVDFENRPQILKARGRDLGQDRNIENVFFACYERISDRDLGLDGEYLVKLKEQVSQLKPRLLVIDPLRLATNLDTNDAQKVVALVEKTSELLEINPQMGILILHHLKKQHEQDPSKRLRLRSDPAEWVERVHGSQALLAHVETIIGLEQDGEDQFTLATIPRSSEAIVWTLEKAPGSLRFVLAGPDAQLKTWPKKQREHWEKLPVEFTRKEGDDLIGHSTCDRLIRKALPLGMLEQDKATKCYRKTNSTDTINRGTSGIMIDKEEFIVGTDTGTGRDSVGLSTVPMVPLQSQFEYPA